MLTIQRFIFNPFQENTYILYNESGKAIIIDPGFMDNYEKKQFIDFIDEKKLQPVYLLNTHCHIDHILGNQFVYEKWDLPLHIHEGEQVVLKNAPIAAEMFGLALNNYTGNLIFLKEGEDIQLGNDTLSILLTPGHSPASVSFYNQEDTFVISGDVLFSGSIGRTDLPGGNFETLEHSIRTQLYILPDDVKVYPGHGPGTSIGFEKKNNPFVQEL